MSMRIGELARVTGESVKTLRFWTEAGLLRAARGDNRYRYYPEGSERRATTIRRIQRLGFSLAEIRSMLALRERGVEPCDSVRRSLRRHLDEARRRRLELERLEAELEARLAWASEHAGDDCDDADAVCVILEEHAASP